jgi:phospholipid-binding lipoprotein MlaA
MRGLIAAISVAAAYWYAPAFAHALDAAGQASAAAATPQTTTAPQADVPAPAAQTAPEAQSDDDAVTSIPDPWEGFNRHMYAVNDAADRVAVEPVARGYRAVTPRPLRTGVSNFLSNLGSPVTFVNDLLQGQIGRAGTIVARLGINSTLGVFGLFDPATDFGFERHEEDFGQTLAVWGVHSGPYLFVPLLGPTTVRDGAGRVIDLAFDPLNWARFDHANEVRATRIVVGAISTREELLDPVDTLRRTSIDPYATVRATYQLTRESEIRNGLVDDEETPTLDDSSTQAPDPTVTPATPPAGAEQPSTQPKRHPTHLKGAKTPASHTILAPGDDQ